MPNIQCNSMVTTVAATAAIAIAIAIATTIIVGPYFITKKKKKKKTTSNKKELDLLGVSVFYLQTKFMQEVDDFGTGLNINSKVYEIENLDDHDQNGVIRQKGANVTCPITGRKGAAYVHTLSHVDHVGPASIMLSYTWGYEIGDIINVLEEYCRRNNNLDPKRTYVWICCLCVNQHEVVDKKKRGEVISFEEFRQVFFRRVTDIGHILAMMDPWTDPSYLRRVWCIFELFTASRQPGCKVTIEMPSRERTKFLDGLASMDGNFGHMLEFFDTLDATNVENAQASVESDRENILKTIKEETSYKQFDIIINNRIRQWAIQLILDAAASKFENGEKGIFNKEYDFFHQKVGILLANIGEYEQALIMFEKEMEMAEKRFGRNIAYNCFQFANMAQIFQKQDKDEEALDYYNRALVILEAIEGNNEEFIMSMRSNMASIYSRRGDVDRALRECKDTGDLALLLNNEGRYEEAMEKHQEALSAQKEKSQSDNAYKARLLHNMAMTMANQGKYWEAMENFKQSLTIRKKLLGENHPSTVRTRKHITQVQNNLIFIETGNAPSNITLQY